MIFNSGTDKTKDLRDSIAKDYSPSSTYASGDYAWHEGKLYRAKQDITTAEAWTEAHWEIAEVCTDLQSKADKTLAIMVDESGRTYIDDGEDEA